MQSPVECFLHLAFGKKFRMSHFNAVGKVPGQAIKEWPERGQIARSQYWLQLPATFGPRDLPALWPFLDGLPRDFTYGVEVRHPEFFAKGEVEKALNVNPG